MVKDVSYSVIHYQLISEKEKQNAFQKKKEGDQKRKNDKKKEIDLRIRY